MTALMLMLVA